MSMPGNQTEAADASPAAPTTARKRFNLVEANRALIYVRPVVDDITRQYEQIILLRRSMENPSLEGLDGTSVEQAEAAYEAAMDRLGGLVDELHEAGVELRDFERGVVAFPAECDGRTILYSWQPDEEDVTHYHEQDESITQRRPLQTLAQAA